MVDGQLAGLRLDPDLTPEDAPRGAGELFFFSCLMATTGGGTKGLPTMRSLTEEGKVISQ